jgi:hypothetical protein
MLNCLTKKRKVDNKTPNLLKGLEDTKEYENKEYEALPMISH